MTTIIGTGEVGALHSREELEEMQRLPLQRKIQITTARIIEWYQHYDGKVYVAFSGILRFQRKLDIVTGRSSMSTLPLPVTMMWYGPSCWATFPCVVRKAWRAPPRVLLRSA